MRKSNEDNEVGLESGIMGQIREGNGKMREG